MLTLWNQFDDLFSDELLRNRRAAPSFVPAVDIEESGDSYLVTADIPGVAPKDINVTVEDGVLTISGHRSAEQKKEERGYRRIERSFGTFQRSFVLPKGVRQDAVEARVEHGQLAVRIPKPAATLPRKIDVKVEADRPLDKTG